MTYSIEHGAVGATCNPAIVVGVLKKEMATWKDRIRSLIDEMPTATEDQIGWQIVREISVKAAGLLLPIFERQHGRNGRLSIQTDPRLYRNTKAILEQATEFSLLAPNIIVKIPVTRAGLPAIEEATHRGVSINATVSFTLPQAIAVAEAVERGLKRRESVPRIDKPVEPKVVDALSKSLSILAELSLREGCRLKNLIHSGRLGVLSGNSSPGVASSERLYAILCSQSGRSNRAIRIGMERAGIREAAQGPDCQPGESLRGCTG